MLLPATFLLLLASATGLQPQISSSGSNITIAVDNNGTIAFQMGSTSIQLTDLASTASVLDLVNNVTAVFSNSLNAALARITTLEQNTLAASSLAMGTPAGFFHASAIGSGTLAAGWAYLWNTGTIGMSALYEPLVWNVGIEKWAVSGSTYGSGPSGNLAMSSSLSFAGPTRTQAASNGTSRYAIAAYTIAQPGIYFLSNTTITPGVASCATGSIVRVYVNDVLVKLVSATALASSAFDTVLGSLNSGDVVYVAVGAAADAACSPQFVMDYTLQQFASANLAAAMAVANMVPANSIVATSARVCEPTDAGVVYSVGGTLQLCTSVGWAGYSTTASANATLTNYVSTTLAAYPTLRALNATLAGYPTNANLSYALLPYATTAAVASTYATLAGVAATYATQSGLTTALAAYSTSASIASTYLTQASFSSTIAAYSTSTAIASIYVTQTSLATTLAAYSTNASIASTYLTQASFSSTIAAYSTSTAIASIYVTQTSLATTLAAYSTSANIASTYVNQTSLANTLSAYSTTANITAKYVPITTFNNTAATLSQSLSQVTAQSSQTTATVTAMRGVAVAGYRNDFMNPPKAGWAYLWNGQGAPIGVTSKYTPLVWSQNLNLDGYNGYNGDGTASLPVNGPAQWMCLTWLGGHAGSGVTDGASAPYPSYSRYAIAAYMVSTTGVYALVNTSVTGYFIGGCGANAQFRLKIYVNTTFYRDYIVTRTEVNTNFDTRFGLLPANTTIYVALGSGDDGVGCDHFSWDFTVMQFPNDYFSMATGTIAFSRTYSGLQTTFAGFRRAFHSPPYLREGWAYMWNANGAIGNSSNYALLIWDGVAEYSGTGSPTFPNTGNSAYCQVNAQGGHPGPAVPQGQAFDRYSITAYTMQYSAEFQISNSYIERTNLACGTGNGIAFRVYVNNNLIVGPTNITTGTALYFNTYLGYLFGGDVVYVMVGPAGADSCGSFAMDYEIRDYYTLNGLNDAIAGGDSGSPPGSITI